MTANHRDTYFMKTKRLLRPRWHRPCRLLLSIGVCITLFISIILIAWQEHLVDVDLPYNPVLQIRERPVPLQEEQELDWPPVLSAYLEPSSSYDSWYENPTSKDPKIKKPLPLRGTLRQALTRLDFPILNYTNPAGKDSICSKIPTLLPIDDFGTIILDPYLPWIHDLFLSHDGKFVNIVAQNRRRCHKGKNHLDEMKFWEGQVALFQPVAVKRINVENKKIQYRLSTHEEADPDGLETRFICRFKTIDHLRQKVVYSGETLSTYPFNYEFVNWRKMKKTMVEDSKDQTAFWLSPLMFHCPIPSEHQQEDLKLTNSPQLLLDIIPIRTPVRRNDRDGFFFHEGHGGPTSFDAMEWFGNSHVLPKLDDSGRWENLPVCSLKPPETREPQNSESRTMQIGPEENAYAISSNKPHRLVACTWTSALHQRRGNERRISDGKSRLREWIAFHLEAGFDHMYIFDNTGANATIFRLKNEVDPDLEERSDQEKFQIRDNLSSVTNLFPSSKVTRIDWPATICNNNRPAHDDPGERSSQYAAEAACRLRYGPYTDWMASMDPDEYFIPMGNNTSWKEILEIVDKTEGRKVLKFRSTRARPLLSRLVYDKFCKNCVNFFIRCNNSYFFHKFEFT